MSQPSAPPDTKQEFSVLADGIVLVQTKHARYEGFHTWHAYRGICYALPLLPRRSSPYLRSRPYVAPRWAASLVASHRPVASYHYCPRHIPWDPPHHPDQIGLPAELRTENTLPLDFKHPVLLCHIQPLGWGGVLAVQRSPACHATSRIFKSFKNVRTHVKPRCKHGRGCF